VTTKTRTRSRKQPAETPATTSTATPSKGMILVLTTGRAEEVDGKVVAWDEGDELVVGRDVDVDEAIRMLEAELAVAKVDPPARSAGERR
jgi:hypothetical protein